MGARTRFMRDAGDAPAAKERGPALRGAAPFFPGAAPFERMARVLYSEEALPRPREGSHGPQGPAAFERGTTLLECRHIVLASEERVHEHQGRRSSAPRTRVLGIGKERPPSQGRATQHGGLSADGVIEEMIPVCNHPIAEPFQALASLPATAAPEIAAIATFADSTTFESHDRPAHRRRRVALAHPQPPTPRKETRT